MARTYEQKYRGQSREQTHQRIIDAAICLHQVKGMQATSMEDVADQAGVGRATVYRHFPNEEYLAAACSGKYFEEHPFPNIEMWRKVADPAERLFLGLSESYAYHRQVEDMLAQVMPEARLLPMMKPYFEYWDQAGAVILSAYAVRGKERRKLKAAISLSISFDTWQMLVRKQGLSNVQAVQLMHGFVSG